MLNHQHQHPNLFENSSSSSSSTSRISPAAAIHPHRQQAHHSSWPSASRPHVQSILTRRHPSQVLTRPLTPLFTLAAYGSLAIATFSALIGLILASYGLSAWDDAKGKLIGVRGMIGKGLEAGKEIVGAVTSTAFPSQAHHRDRTTIPRRATPHQPHPSTSRNPGLAGYDQASSSPTGYSVPIDDQDISTPFTKPSKDQNTTDSQSHTPPSQSTLPPRPPLSILIASLFITLIVVTARLMVVWWMGQQAQKNSTQAFRNAQRAYEAAQEQEEQSGSSSLPHLSTNYHRRQAYPKPSHQRHQSQTIFTEND